jgi:hypothetical protein
MGVANWVFGRGWFGDLELYFGSAWLVPRPWKYSRQGADFQNGEKTGCFVPVLGQAFPDANQLLTLDVEMLRL